MVFYQHGVGVWAGFVRSHTHTIRVSDNTSFMYKFTELLVGRKGLYSAFRNTPFGVSIVRAEFTPTREIIFYYHLFYNVNRKPPV